MFLNVPDDDKKKNIKNILCESSIFLEKQFTHIKHVFKYAFVDICTNVLFQCVSKNLEASVKKHTQTVQTKGTCSSSPALQLILFLYTLFCLQDIIRNPHSRPP